MTHRATADFWRLFDHLPPPEQARARANYALLKSDPRHPSLHFKQIGNFWSVRVGLRYRALAAREGDVLVWFWIGSHADYDGLVGRG